MNLRFTLSLGLAPVYIWAAVEGHPLATPKATTQGEQHLAFWLLRYVRPESYVYVLQSETAGTPIKVGIARDVKARIATLQTGNPQRLRLLHVVPGDHVLEWNFHRRLRSGHVLGEWFDGPAVKSFLGFVAKLADRMVEVGDEIAGVPHFSDFGVFELRDPRIPGPPESKPLRANVAHRWRCAGPKDEVVVRYVEPDPVIDPEKAQEMRDLVSGVSPSLLFGSRGGPRRISNNPAFNPF